MRDRVKCVIIGLTPAPRLGYNADMARTASLDTKSAEKKSVERKSADGTAQKKGRRGRKREQPLGVAIALGLAAALAAGIVIALASVLIPGTAAHQFYALVHSIHSATLPLDPLYQDWAGKMQEEDALFGTPLSLLCGGLTLGWLAPSYVSRRRVLLSGGLMGFGFITAAITFVWVIGILNQSMLNRTEGGQQVNITAPPELIIKQAVIAVLWTGVCVLGSWLGLRLRERARQKTQQAAH